MNSADSTPGTLPTYTLHYTTTPNGGKNTTHKLELPRQLDRAEAVFWASVILTDIANDNSQTLHSGHPNNPFLRISDNASTTESVAFSILISNPEIAGLGKIARTEHPEYFKRLVGLEAPAKNIWGKDVNARTWDIRDIWINHGNEMLKDRPLNERAQEFIKQSGGTLEKAAKVARLIDPSDARIFWNSTKKSNSGK